MHIPKFSNGEMGVTLLAQAKLKIFASTKYRLFIPQGRYVRSFISVREFAGKCAKITGLHCSLCVPNPQYLFSLLNKLIYRTGRIIAFVNRQHPIICTNKVNFTLEYHLQILSNRSKSNKKLPILILIRRFQATDTRFVCYRENTRFINRIELY